MNHLEPKHIHHQNIQPDDELIDEDDFIEPKKGFFNSVFGIFSNLLVSDHKVGELNGRWAVLFKFVLIVAMISVPTFLGWATWVTNRIFSAQYHELVTADFSERLLTLEANNKILLRLEAQVGDIIKKMDTLPPPEWRRRIELLEQQYDNIEQDIINVDKTNSDEHGKILILLEGIKTKVDLIKDE